MTRWIIEVSAGLGLLLVLGLGLALAIGPHRMGEAPAGRPSASTEVWRFQCAQGPLVVRLVTPDLLLVGSPGLVRLFAAADGTELPSWNRADPPDDLTEVAATPRLPPGSALAEAVGRPCEKTLRRIGPYVAVRSVPPIAGVAVERVGDVGVYDALTGAFLISFPGETSLAASTDGVIYAGSWDGLVSAHRVVGWRPGLLADTVP